jgi:hypothetical protein
VVDFGHGNSGEVLVWIGTSKQKLLQIPGKLNHGGKASKGPIRLKMWSDSALQLQ